MISADANIKHFKRKREEFGLFFWLKKMLSLSMYDANVFA